MMEQAFDTAAIASQVAALEQALGRLKGMLRGSETESASSLLDHPYIGSFEGTLSGEPVIKGTRTPVRAIAEHWKFGDSPEDIAEKLPHLRLAQIFDALAYYDDHRDEIERYIRANRVPVDD